MWPTPAASDYKYQPPHRGDALGDLAFDRIGALWFTELAPGAIGRLHRSGGITTYPITWHPVVSTVAATPSVKPQYPWGITFDRVGNRWFTAIVTNEIVRRSPNGALRRFAIPTAESAPLALARGAGG